MLIASKLALFFGVRFERRKVDKKQTYMKTETCKLYSRDFWIFLPKIIKIDLYNSELYSFEVGAFFQTQCRRWRDGAFVSRDGVPSGHKGSELCVLCRHYSPDIYYWILLVHAPIEWGHCFKRWRRPVYLYACLSPCYHMLRMKVNKLAICVTRGTGQPEFWGYRYVAFALSVP